ncbi:MAG TPA: cytochrome c [Phenylobacterium sp.]|uniref:c-type cytochrome n=1 Tax=Phenylobacterium sp. TaxID=1871053 RepID=UPI002C6410DB|nr:cytochrome c [Phenylobacterium sp.]HSV03157.1 cytochrome c [Phenylobacterium sp.]
MSGTARSVIVAGLALSLAAGAAAAQSAMAGAVKERQAHFLQQGAAFKAVLDELKKDQPDKGAIAANAAKLKDLAAHLPTWFPNGSGPEAGVKTEAKPEIWAQPSEFADAARRLQAETVKLDQLAMAGDLDGVKMEARMVGGACKNCHDNFRAQAKS